MIAARSSTTNATGLPWYLMILVSWLMAPRWHALEDRRREAQTFRCCVAKPAELGERDDGQPRAGSGEQVGAKLAQQAGGRVRALEGPEQERERAVRLEHLQDAGLGTGDEHLVAVDGQLLSKRLARWPVVVALTL